MKLLGFQPPDHPSLPVPTGRDPRAGLQIADPDAYAGLITHLTRGDRRLQAWVDSLASGETVVVLTGQQPALLGGPLYTLYKTWTAIESARRLRADGQPAVAAFWCVGDDTDHDEVASVSWPLQQGPPRRLRDELPSGGDRIGSLPVSRMQQALRQLREDWPRADFVHRLLAEIVTDADIMNWSSFLKRSLISLAADEPVLFLDGNDPVVIEASQSWLRGFAWERRLLAEGLDREADRIRAVGGSPPISGEEARRCLFVLEGQGRRALAENEEPGPGAILLPNVVLRPALQEYLLPVARVICGEAEIAYRTLLGPVYALMGRPAAALARRFSATIFPSAWSRDRDLADAMAALSNPEEAMDAWARRIVDPEPIRSIERARASVGEALRQLEEPMAHLDRSLKQLLDSVAGKVDFQFGRLDEAVLAKGRLVLSRRDAALAHLREILRPRGRLQERVFTLWTPFLSEGEAALPVLREAVQQWFERDEAGHALLATEDAQ